MKLIVGVCLMGVALAGHGMGGGMGGGMAGEDSDKQCCGWAIMDECETNPFWMKVNCQKSCGTVGCTVAEAKSNAMGATGACVSQLDMAALASCPWNKEFLQANWNSASVAAPVDPAPAVPAAPVDPAPAPATEESKFIVPDAAPAPDMGGYGAEKPEIIVEEVLPEIQADEPAATTMEPTDAPTTAAATTMAPTTAAPTTAAPTTIAATEAPTTAAPTTAAATEAAPEAPEAPIEEEAPEAPEAPEEEETPEAAAAEDTSESCCGWAAYEECGKNSAWMATNCAKSCFVTDGQVDNEAAIANAEEQCAEYRELFLAGVPLGGQKEEAPETPVEEEEAAPEAPVDAEEAPEAPEAPEVAPEAPEAPEVEEAPEAPEAPVEEAEEAPAMDPVVEDHMNGGYRRKFRASRRN